MAQLECADYLMRTVFIRSLARTESWRELIARLPVEAGMNVLIRQISFATTEIQ